MNKGQQQVMDMRGQREKGIVGYRHFIKVHAINKKAPFCLVEGEDAKYFFPRIMHSCNTAPEFIPCGGKKGVINGFKKIKEIEKYKNCKVLAFVDRDFDETEVENIYTTPHFSVENFYTSKAVVLEILKHEFKLNDLLSIPDLGLCINLYEQRQKEFHEASSLLNAWIACQRVLENTNENYPGINLQKNHKKIIKNFFAINVDNVLQNYTLEDIETLYPEAPKVSLKDLTLKQDELRKRKPQSSYRGKYEIEFTRIFLDKLKTAINNGSFVLSQKKKIDLHLTPTNILSELSQYAESSICLKDYVENIWNSRMQII